MTDEEIIAKEVVKPKFWADLAASVKQHVENVTRPLQDRIASLESRAKRYEENGVIDRGDYEPGQRYEKGDWVRSSGCIWKALSTTTDRPAPGTTWKLMIRKGRDGKDGRDAA
jgi:hypothetical protein